VNIFNLGKFPSLPSGPYHNKFVGLPGVNKKYYNITVIARVRNSQEL